MKKMTLKSILLGTAVAWSSIASAQEISLRSNDGSIDLSGELIEYQDNIYVISTDFGAVRVQGDQVECIGTACPDIEVLDNEVTFSGSATIADGLLPVLLETYAASLGAEPQLFETIGNVETNTQFIDDFGFGNLIQSYRVRSSVSSDGFVNLLGKSTEIGLSSRRITVEEARTLRDYGAGSMVSVNNEHIFASDSIIVVTHPSNPVSSLTMDQLAGIYSGRISNWSEVGGNDAPIAAIHVARGSGTRGVFEERVLQGAPGTPVTSLEVSGKTDVAQAIDENPNAIGYLSIAFKRGAQAVTLTNECGISMEPDEFTAKTGEYFLQRPLYMYTRGDTITPLAQDFLDWALSSEADSAVAKSGFVDLGISTLALGSDSLRAQDLRNAGLDAYETGFANDLIAQMEGKERLSTTFRFFTGSNRLTPQSRVGLDRLIDYLEGQPAGEVVLAGFTDNEGPFDANISISQDRATFMADLIATAGAGRLDHLTFVPAGYGPLAPSACNTDPAGRAINRRIEVWVNADS